ncbi:MAG: glycosyl hydrolase [Kofleriaceae bacterium]
MPGSDGSGSNDGTGSDHTGSDTASAKDKIIAYLAAQSPANGGGIVNGAYVSLYSDYHPLEIFFNEQANAEDTSLITQGKANAGLQSSADTGKAPAILGFQFNTNDGIRDGFPYVHYSTIPMINSWIASGGIAIVGGWSYLPVDRSIADASQRRDHLADPAAAARMVDDPNSAEGIALDGYFSDLATYFKKLNGPVLWRPWIEPNLGGPTYTAFWWDRSTFTAAQQKKLYILEWQYMKDHGVDNLIWVFNANTGVGGYTDSYPGDDYVDIVSMDAYPVQADSYGMYQDMTTDHVTGEGAHYTATKPLFFAEAGCAPFNVLYDAAYHQGNWDTIRQTLQQSYPKVFGLVTWMQGLQVGNQLGGQAFMTNTITRDELPSFYP